MLLGYDSCHLDAFQKPDHFEANWCPKWLFLYFAIWIPHYLLQKSPVFKHFQISGILNSELHWLILGFLYAIFVQWSRLAKRYILTPLHIQFSTTCERIDSKCICQRSFFAQRERVKLLSSPKKSYFHSPLELFWLTMTSQKKAELYSIVWKWKKWEGNKSMETTFPDFRHLEFGALLYLDAPGCKFNSYGWLWFQVELIPSESRQKVTFANARISNQNNWNTKK